MKPLIPLAWIKWREKKQLKKEKKPQETETKSLLAYSRSFIARSGSGSVFELRKNCCRQQNKSPTNKRVNIKTRESTQEASKNHQQICALRQVEFKVPTKHVGVISEAAMFTRHNGNRMDHPQRTQKAAAIVTNTFLDRDVEVASSHWFGRGAPKFSWQREGLMKILSSDKQSLSRNVCTETKTRRQWTIVRQKVVYHGHCLSRPMQSTERSRESPGLITSARR